MRLLLVGRGPAGAATAMQARSRAPTSRWRLKPSRSGNRPEQRTGAAPIPSRAARVAGDRSAWERFGLDGRSKLVHPARHPPGVTSAPWNQLPGRRSSGQGRLIL